MNATSSYRTRHERPAADPVAIGLQALAWIASDPERIGRMLTLTGLNPTDLRARAAEPAVLAAALGFLEGHEPDLVACADAIGAEPATLVSAREALGA